MRFVSCDLETTGLNEKNCDIVEFGAVIDDLSLGDDQVRPIFHRYIASDQFKGEPYALGMHGQIFKRIATKEKGFEYVNIYELAHQFSSWLSNNGFDNKGKITFAGKNFASFDSKFLNLIPGWNNIKIHHRVLDPGNLYFNPKTDSCIPDSKECMKRADLAGEVAHTAVEDALMVIKILRFKLLNQD